VRLLARGCDRDCRLWCGRDEHQIDARGNQLLGYLDRHIRLGLSVLHNDLEVVLRLPDRHSLLEHSRVFDGCQDVFVGTGEVGQGTGLWRDIANLIVDDLDAAAAFEMSISDAAPMPPAITLDACNARRRPNSNSLQLAPPPFFRPSNSSPMIPLKECSVMLSTTLLNQMVH